MLCLIGISTFLFIYYQEQQVCYGVIKNNEVPLLMGPDAHFQAVATITRGDQVTILDRRSDWYKIQYGSTIGWVANKEIIVST
jgi:uncharacterized protein YgiM (DUF1202 family)